MLKNVIFYIFGLGLILIIGLGYIFTWILVPGAIGGLIGLTVAMATIRGISAPNKLKKYLKEKGKCLKAEILDVDIKENVTINNNWSPATLKLKVKDQFSSYHSELKVLISHARGNIYEIGQELDVMVDTANPYKIMHYEDFIAPERKQSPIIKNILRTIGIGLFLTIILVFSVQLIPGTASGTFQDLAYIPDSSGFGYIWSLEKRELNSRCRESVRIFDIDKNKTIKVLTFAIDSAPRFHNYMAVVDTMVYFYEGVYDYSYSYMGVGMKTGTIQETIEDFQKRKPEFASGVYKITNHKATGDDVVYVTTNDGEDFYYNYRTNSIIEHSSESDKVFHFVSGKGEREYLSYKTFKTVSLHRNEYRKLDDSLRKKEKMYDGKVSYELERFQYNISDYTTRQNYQLTIDSVISNENIIIQPQELYANDSIIIFKYRKSINEQEPAFITIYTKYGEVLWETQHSIFAEAQFEAIHNNSIILSKYNKICAVSLDDGELLWSYSEEQFWTFGDKVSYVLSYIGLGEN